MTLAVENPVTSYATDGMTGSYPLGFTYSQPKDVQAVLTDASGHVSVPAFSISGGNAVLAAIPAAGGTIVFSRMTPVNQLADFASGNTFASGVADSAFDRIVRMVQELSMRVATLTAGPPATGQATTINLFSLLSTVIVPLPATAFLTGGYAVGGIGGGTYVADPLATAALAASCPRFCAADAMGRYFRLVATNGVLAISQAGALGGTANDQPAVQAAINYAKVIGARVLLFDFDVVSLWCPVRTSAPDEWSLDGQSMIVSAPIKFLGLPTQTHIRMLSTTGGSLETGFQNVGGAVWRGSGIRLYGGPNGLPNAYGLTFFGMENIWLDGGCTYTGSRNQVITPATPDGPDLTNKGLHLQDTQCDAITLINSKISGFKGEAYYCAGTTETLQILNNVSIWGSNQSAFNPSTGVVWASNCEFGNSFLAVESLGRTGGRYSNCRFHDCIQMGCTGGPANGILYNYAYPSRLTTQAPPWVDMVSCEFVNAGQIIVGNYIRITRARITDSNFYLITGTALAGGNGSMTSTYIDGTYTVDQTSQNPICTIQGPPTLTTGIPNAPAGTYIQPVSDVHIRLDVHRTAQARANGLYAVGYSIGGYFDQNSCSLAIGEADGLSTMVTPAGNSSSPLLIFDGPTSSQTIGAGRPWGYYPYVINAGPSYAMTVSNPRHALEYYGAATAIAITIAAPFTAPYGYANGQICRVWYGAQNTVGTTLTFAHNAAGLRLNADCTLAVVGDWIALEFNVTTGLWHESGRSIHAA